MSDMQLATGIAILISGYSQLHCGLSCYHWKVVGRLAWFSSLTHLSCLTLLRNHLYNNPAERQWRLLFMFILIVMHITAMVPTSNYDWDVTNMNRPLQSDYAICYFTKPPSPGSTAYMTVITLVLLIGLGFAIRVIRLYKWSSVSFVRRTRRGLGNAIQKFLWMLYSWRETPAIPVRLTGSILYFPALALFLTLRVLLDHWSSMFFEV